MGVSGHCIKDEHDDCPNFEDSCDCPHHLGESAIRQINLTDEQLFDRLFEKMNKDKFARPLIRVHIDGHRNDDPESTAWIRKVLGWDQG